MRWLVVFVLFVLTGCTQPPEDAFVLEYEIVDVASGPKSAQPGVHCATAAMTGQKLEIGLWPGEKRQEGPWLAVFPTLPESWGPVYDGEPFKTNFPATVDPRVQDDDAILGELAWGGPRGALRLDGAEVSLPHSWSVHSDGWRADATVSAWRGQVDVKRFAGLCD